MFDVRLRSPSDGIASGPSGEPHTSNNLVGGCRTETWRCVSIEDEATGPSCNQLCLSINTCEPYDAPEYDGANEYLANAGAEPDEEPV